MARALSDNDLEKSKILLEQSLELSPSSEEGREILRIYLNLDKNFGLIDRYCKEYSNTFLTQHQKKIKTFF